MSSALTTNQRMQLEAYVDLEMWFSEGNQIHAASFLDRLHLCGLYTLLISLKPI